MEQRNVQPINNTYLNWGKSKHVWKETLRMWPRDCVIRRLMQTGAKDFINYLNKAEKGEGIRAAETLPVTTRGNRTGQQNLHHQMGGWFNYNKIFRTSSERL